MPDYFDEHIVDEIRKVKPQPIEASHALKMLRVDLAKLPVGEAAGDESVARRRRLEELTAEVRKLIRP